MFMAWYQVNAPCMSTIRSLTFQALHVFHCTRALSLLHPNYCAPCSPTIELIFPPFSTVLSLSSSLQQVAEIDAHDVAVCYAADEYLVLGELQGDSEYDCHVFRFHSHMAALQLQNAVAHTVLAAHAQLSEAVRQRRKSSVTVQSPPPVSTLSASTSASGRRGSGVPISSIPMAPAVRTSRAASVSASSRPATVDIPPPPPGEEDVNAHVLGDEERDDFGYLISALKGVGSGNQIGPAPIRVGSSDDSSASSVGLGHPGPPREAFVTAAEPTETATDMPQQQQQQQPGWHEGAAIDSKAVAAEHEASREHSSSASGSDGDAGSMVLDLDRVAEAGDDNDNDDQLESTAYSHAQGMPSEGAADIPGYVDTHHLTRGEPAQYADLGYDGPSANPYLDVSVAQPSSGNRTGTGTGESGYLDVSHGHPHAEADHVGGGSGYLDVSRGHVDGGSGRARRLSSGNPYLDVSPVASSADASGQPNPNRGYLAVESVTPSVEAARASDATKTAAHDTTHRGVNGTAAPLDAAAMRPATLTEAEEAEDDEFKDLAFVLSQDDTAPEQSSSGGAQNGEKSAVRADDELADLSAQAESMLRQLTGSGQEQANAPTAQ